MPSIPEMERRGWGDPTDSYYYPTNITTLTVAGRSLRVRREVKPLFHALILMLEREGVDISKGPLDDWGYALREIRGYEGTGLYSNHSWGLAIDLDALKNPMGSSQTTFPVGPTRRFARDCSLVWGYDWSSRPDPQHFEFTGQRRDVWDAYARLRRTHPVIWRKVKN